MLLNMLNDLAEATKASDGKKVFVWALAPFFGFCSVFCCLLRCSPGETQIWLGDLRVVVFCLVVVFGFEDPLSLYSVFSAYFHVRTEPLARHRPHSKKKKLRIYEDIAILASPRLPGWGDPWFPH